MIRVATAILCGCLAFAHLVGGADFDPWLPATAAAILISCTCVIVLVRPGRMAIATLVGAVLLGAAGLSGLAGNWYVARNEYLALWTALSLFSTAFVVGRNARLCKWAVQTFQIAGLAFMSTMLLGGLLTNSSESGLFWQSGRLSGFFGSPNTFATLCGIYTLVSASLLSSYMQRWRKRSPARIVIISRTIENRFTSLALLVSSVACLFLSNSRAAILITLVLLALMAVLAWRNGEKKGSGKYRGVVFAALSIIVVGLAATALLAAPQLSDRLDSLEADWVDRWDTYQLYWQLWQQDWLLGHGLGSFNAVNDAAMNLENGDLIYTLGAAHNLELQWLLQVGVAGTLAGVLVLGAMVWPSAKRYFSVGSGDVAPSLPRAALFVSILVLVHGQVDYALEIPSVMWTYSLLLGLGAGTSSMIREAPAEGAGTGRQE